MLINSKSFPAVPVSFPPSSSLFPTARSARNMQSRNSISLLKGVDPEMGRKEYPKHELYRGTERTAVNKWRELGTTVAFAKNRTSSNTGEETRSRLFREAAKRPTEWDLQEFLVSTGLTTTSPVLRASRL